jgi:hypothetical protein
MVAATNSNFFWDREYESPTGSLGSIHLERLRARLDPRLTSETIARLLTCERLRTSLTRMACGDLAEIGESDGEEQSAVPKEQEPLLAHDPGLIARLAGAVWHGRSLRALISGRDVAALSALVGKDVHVCGVRNAEFARASEIISDPYALADVIVEDGHACLGAWLETASSALRRCMLLRLPPGTRAEVGACDEGHKQSCGSIMTRIWAHLAEQERG